MFQYIIDYKIKNNGNSPRIREIATAFNTSTSVIAYNLNALEADGLIKRRREVARMIEIPGYAFVRVAA